MSTPATGGVYGHMELRPAGDRLLALFAEPQAAARAAQDMAEVLGLFNQERSASDQSPVACGIGIARGELVIGTATTKLRAAYACIGAAVLRAQHLAAACAAGSHDWLLDEGIAPQT